MYFYNVYKKEGFLDYKNFIFTESKKLYFFKGVNPYFGQKFEIFF